eukprot:m.360060 g.360060  ORF g.360060 m.360060 type:complete len:1203 (-) comp18864_c0_seq1:145-3753(-)
MHLYSLTLQAASEITVAAHGNFTGTKQQFIAVARGKVLELLKAEPSTGKLQSICSTDVFGLIRSLKPFRLTGSGRDYLVVGSDSGRITILEYNQETNAFKKVHQETYGKSGCRRIVPGQYLATDPKGRAVMIGAFEKQKLVYILNRDAAARLTISSPLEAHKAHAMVYDMIGIDVGFDNPVFACLELDYEDVDEDVTGEARDMLNQTITYYQLDLGLNHVVRKESTPLDEFANKLIPVPGGADGPGGMLVCTEGRITWRTFGDHEAIGVNIPRRADPLRVDSAPIVNCYTMHKTKRVTFFLIQTEEGDVFKLTIIADKTEMRGLVIKYFDTLPVANSMCLLKSGMLFVAAEFGNHMLYQVAELGDNEDEPSWVSTDPVEEIPYFTPRDLLNLVPIDELENLSSCLGCEIADVQQEQSPQLYTICGRGARSSLRVLKHGLEVNEIAVSELPGNPSAVWSLKRHIDDDGDKYIVLSFTDKSLVLGIGETVEEVKDSGFLDSVPTMSASRIGDDSLLQIHPEGVRHIAFDGRVNEWKSPGKSVITLCAVNERQVAIALSTNELVYFQLDRSGQLNEFSTHMELPGKPTAMALSPVPDGELNGRFLALAMEDQTVRLVSMEESTCLQTIGMQALPDGGVASSITLISRKEDGGEPSTIQMYVGLDNGVLVKTAVDAVTGDFSDSRKRYLGAKPVRLHRISLQGEDAVIALSTRPWVSYTFQGRPKMTPLSYDMLEYAHAFSSVQCAEGMVAVAQNTLRVLSLDRLGSVFNQSSLPLQFTPRKLLLDEDMGAAIVLESDQGARVDSKKEEVVVAANAAEEASDSAEKHVFQRLPEAQFGEPYAGEGLWASNIRIVDVQDGQLLQLIQFEQDESPLSVARVPFAARDGEAFVIVGVVKGWVPRKGKFASACLRTYKLIAGEDGRLCNLELVHDTPVEDLPGSLAPFQGRMVAGVGRLLRIYDIGRKKLLRKCENKHLPSMIVDIKTMGTRIIVADQKESLFFVKYKPSDNALVIFCDDTNPRWCSAMCLLDYNTACVADKFGNVAVMRCPPDVTDSIDEDPTGAKAFWSRGLLNGAPQKLEVLTTFYVGETIKSLQKVSLSSSASECVMYTTMSGSVGVLMPFTSKDDVEFFQNLEMHLRQEQVPLCGRDHLAFRSYYWPCKCTIDGDLCEVYNSLPSSKKSEIAEGLDLSVVEVAKQIEDFKSRYAF